MFWCSVNVLATILMFWCSINVLATTFVCTILAITLVEEVVGSGSTSGTVAGIATCIYRSPAAAAK